MKLQQRIHKLSLSNVTSMKTKKFLLIRGSVRRVGNVWITGEMTTNHRSGLSSILTSLY